MSGQVDGTQGYFSIIANCGTKYSSSIIKNNSANIKDFSFNFDTKTIKFTITTTETPFGIAQLKFTMLN